MGSEMWEWVVGVGEIVKMDEKGRIIIPASIRRAIGKNTFRVELMGKDTILIKAFEGGRELMERVRDIRLMGDKKRACIDAAMVRDRYGGVKH
jgi:bifunctional DNA-binding transcriptional regulator/antitoxin component of YhaV-PrlF toxin-antitoxin module